MKSFSMNNDWKFMKLPEEDLEQLPAAISAGNYDFSSAEAVVIPHTWYQDDDQYQGLCVYQKNIILSELGEKADKYILQFEGVEQQCKIYVNGTLIGEHAGAYATFAVEIPEIFCTENELTLTVFVTNKLTQDVITRDGDFTIFGGIYRNVNLLTASKNHFDYCYYGTNGLIIRTKYVESANRGMVNIEPHVVLADDNAVICYQIKDENGSVVSENQADAKRGMILAVEEPVLWNGLGDAHLYQLEAKLMVGGVCADETCYHIGFRTFSFDENQGMFLNGKHYRIHGVAIHQDFAGYFNAVGKEQIDENFALIQEIGANALRLSHYQHPKYTYDLCDQLGYPIWSEIPMIKMYHSPAQLENAKSQLTELILQNIHRPSVFSWGIQNEVAMFREDDEVYERCEILSALVHMLDPDRVSAGANLYSVKAKSQMNEKTDIVGYNIYFGWYYGKVEDYREYIDKLHATKPHVKYGISEYGVDASPFLHSKSPVVKDYTEEFQSYFHENAYAIFEEKEYLWGSFIWNMFDFHSSRRDEGGIKFRNTKGLVTYDRKLKKDSFFYYKSKWSKEKVLHICSKRYENRADDYIDVKVYTNAKEVTLELNGNEILTGPTSNCTYTFKHVPLLDGENKICVYANIDGECIKDICVFRKVEKEDESYRLPETEGGSNVKNWFIEDEFTKEGYYSVLYRADELLAQADCRKLIEENLPELFHVMTKMEVIPLGLSLNDILGRELESREDGPEFLKFINSELNKIKDEDF